VHSFVPLVATVLFAAVWSSPVRAEIYSCAGDKGVLFSDSPCPPGYRTNFAVDEPAIAPPSVERAEADRRLMQLEAERQAAEAEAARLRIELERERLTHDLAAQRLDELDRKLDALGEQPMVYGGAAVVPAWGGTFGGALCSPGRRGFRDCAGVHPSTRARIVPRDPRTDCGIAGCTPNIVGTPWRGPTRHLR
jgi:hypothetical protein